MLRQQLKLDPFEEDSIFQGCLEEVLVDIRDSIQLGYERHGDGFAEGGLLAFVQHCFRKSKDQKRIVEEGIDVGDSLEGVSRDLVTFAVLERTFLRMLQKKGISYGS